MDGWMDMKKNGWMDKKNRWMVGWIEKIYEKKIWMVGWIKKNEKN